MVIVSDAVAAPLGKFASVQIEQKLAPDVQTVVIAMPHKFKPENWERLLSATRRALLDPDQFVVRVDISPGSSVADLGAGPGFFTLPLARRVGSSGRVYALDVAPEMVARLEALALPAHVEVLLSGESHIPLPDGSVDAALLAFVLHELESPQAFLSDVRRIMRPGGRLIVIEWVPQVEELGPPLGERIAPETGKAILAEAGWELRETGVANASNYYQVYAAS